MRRRLGRHRTPPRESGSKIEIPWEVHFFGFVVLCQLVSCLMYYLHKNTAQDSYIDEWSTP